MVIMARDINRLSMSILTLGFMLSSSLLILALSPHLLKEYLEEIEGIKISDREALEKGEGTRQVLRGKRTA